MASPQDTAFLAQHTAIYISMLRENLRDFVADPRTLPHLTEALYTTGKHILLGVQRLRSEIPLLEQGRERTLVENVVHSADTLMGEIMCAVTCHVERRRH